MYQVQVRLEEARVCFTKMCTNSREAHLKVVDQLLIAYDKKKGSMWGR